MTNGVSRREFLKYSVATGLLIAAGDEIIENVMAQAATGVTEVDKLTVWVLTDNYYDTNVPDAKITKRFRVGGPGASIHAEHGLSFYIETVVKGKTSACMYDYGLDPVGVMNNVAQLGLDIGKANAFSLSHGHYDHYDAAVRMLKQNQSQIAGKPFCVGEAAFAQRYKQNPGAKEFDDIGQLKKEDIEALGLKVVEVKIPTEIVPGAYTTGNVERVTAYETMPTNYKVKLGDKIENDMFPGEQGLFFYIRGKGLVVLSGCAHRGIVNTIKQAQKASGIEKIHMVMGGFHLISAKPEVIQSTVVDIKAMKPDYVVPTHCTGFPAMTVFSREMPNQFILNTAATKYTITS